MEVTLILNERLYQDIENFSDALGKKVEDYLTEIIEDKIYTEKYGDLNDIINVKKENLKSKEIKNEQSIKKDTEEKKKENILKASRNENTKKEDECIEDMTDVKIKKRVSRTRTIKSK